MKVYLPEIENDSIKLYRSWNNKDNLKNKKEAIQLINKPPVWSVSNPVLL